MNNEFEKPTQVAFSTLTYNEAFTLDPEGNTLFIKTQKVYRRDKGKLLLFNAMQLSLPTGGREPLLQIDDDRYVYKVIITGMTVQTNY